MELTITSTNARRFCRQLLVSLTLLSLAACALENPPSAPVTAKTYAGAQVKFAKSAVAAKPRLLLTTSQVAGHKGQTTDEDGPLWGNLARSQTVTAAVGQERKVSD